MSILIKVIMLTINTILFIFPKAMRLKMQHFIYKKFSQTYRKEDDALNEQFKDMKNMNGGNYLTTAAQIDDFEKQDKFAPDFLRSGQHKHELVSFYEGINYITRVEQNHKVTGHYAKSLIKS